MAIEIINPSHDDYCDCCGDFYHKIDLVVVDDVVYCISCVEMLFI